MILQKRNKTKQMVNGFMPQNSIAAWLSPSVKHQDPGRKKQHFFGIIHYTNYFWRLMQIMKNTKRTKKHSTAEG